MDEKKMDEYFNFVPKTQTFGQNMGFPVEVACFVSYFNVQIFELSRILILFGLHPPVRTLT
jgi:hypothetical protein